MKKIARRLLQPGAVAGLLPLLLVVSAVQAPPAARPSLAPQLIATPLEDSSGATSAPAALRGTGASFGRFLAEKLAAVTGQARDTNAAATGTPFCYYLGVYPVDPRLDPGIARSPGGWPAKPDGTQPTPAPTPLGPDGKPLPPRIEYCHPAPRMTLLRSLRP